MEPLLIGTIGIVVLTVLIMIGLPVAFALWVVGAAGLLYLTNLNNLLGQMQVIAFNWSFNFVIAVVPLFIWMGYIIAESGVAEDLYACLRTWLGWLPGGLGAATSLACAGWGAMSASAWAAIVIFNRIAFPEMMRSGYDKRLASGVICSASLFAYLIPPSTTIIILAMLAEQPIGASLLAGYIPGLLMAILYGIIAIGLGKFLKWGPPIKEKFTWKQRIFSLRNVWGLLLLIVLLVGGIYGGFFSPTQAAAIGCFGALAITAARRRLTWKNFQRGAMASGRVIGMLFALFIGAWMFSRFIVISGFAEVFSEIVLSWEVPTMVVLILFYVMYLILGLAMGGLVMAILTLPFVVPVITALGYSGVWLVILLVIMGQIAELTPPIGMVLFMSKGSLPEDVSLIDIVVGSNIFVIGALILVALMTAFPQIVMFLPETMIVR